LTAGAGGDVAGGGASGIGDAAESQAQTLNVRRADLALKPHREGAAAQPASTARQAMGSAAAIQATSTSPLEARVRCSRIGAYSGASDAKLGGSPVS
jgi:hypothetical protein